MKANEPVGSGNYAPLFLRLTLGSYFLVSGLLKVDQLHLVVDEVKAIGIFSDHFSQIFGVLLPYFEIFTGGLLLLGLWATLAGMIASVLLFLFIYASGLFPTQTMLINKDIILLAGALSLLYSGAGALSMDGARKS
jgi:uncharacterized membrane protein YphA (DoxX/SURF4 family)